MTTLRGYISVHARGFGFVNPPAPAEGPAAFVTPPDMNALLEGDLVDAEVESDGARLTAKRVTLVSRERRELSMA